jgi:hypothetical protein
MTAGRPVHAEEVPIESSTNEHISSMPLYFSSTISGEIKKQFFHSFGEKARGKEKPSARDALRRTILCDFFIITSLVS